MTNRQISPDDCTPVESLCFEKVDRKYIYVRTTAIVLVYVVLMAAATLILTFDIEHTAVWLTVAECSLAVALAVNCALARGIYNFKGYALRDKDISYRSGIVFPKIITIPFSKIQQVSIRMNPLSRMFGLYYLDVINGSQDAMNRITIPGLKAATAEKIKSVLINKADCIND